MSLITRPMHGRQLAGPSFSAKCASSSALVGTSLLVNTWGCSGLSWILQLMMLVIFLSYTLIGMIIAAPSGGLSLGWWKRTHNVHHIVTNSPEHDPDNQHLPEFAIDYSFLGNIWSTYHELLLILPTTLQLYSWSLFKLLALGCFNLSVQSWKSLL